MRPQGKDCLVFQERKVVLASVPPLLHVTSQHREWTSRVHGGKQQQSIKHRRKRRMVNK